MPFITKPRHRVDVFWGFCEDCDRTGVSMAPHVDEVTVALRFEQLQRCPDCGTPGREVVFYGDPGRPENPELAPLYDRMARGGGFE